MSTLYIAVNVKLEEREDGFVLQGFEPTYGAVGILPLGEVGLGAHSDVQLLQLHLAHPTEMVGSG